MTDFTRLTIVGADRKADLVIPNDEAIGGLLPRLMELLGETAGSVARPLTLVRTTGEQLDVALSAADQDIADGELLRFVRADDAPPPPEVADVTDVLGESLRDRAGLWGDRSRRLAGAVAVGGLSAAIAALLRLPVPPLLGAYAALVLVALVAGLLRVRWGALAGTAAALGLAVVLGWQHGPAVARVGSVTAARLVMTTALAWLGLGIGFGYGLRSRPARLGCALGLGFALLPLLLVGPAGVHPEGAVAIVAVVAVVACGVLPRAALAASGLTGLDDEVVEGQLRRRDDVELTVNDAYRSLSWAAFAVAAALAVCSAALLASPHRWAWGLGVAVALVTALRTRAFPLAAAQLALWGAVLVGLVAGVVRQPLLSPTSAAAVLAVAVAVVAVLVLVQPPAHTRAFWRRTGNLVEALAVIATIPLLLGLFGIYADLLKAFR